MDGIAFTFLDIILVLGISQGIFLELSLRSIHNRNKKANSALSILIAIAVFMLFGRLAVFRWEGVWVYKIAVLVDTTIFIFGPLFYFYCHRLIYSRSKHLVRNTYHYVLGALHLIFATVYACLPTALFLELKSRAFHSYAGFVIETLGVISLMYYTLTSLKMVVAYKKDVSKNLSFIPQVRVYLLVLCTAMMLFTLLWVISYITGYFIRIRLPFFNYTAVWVVIPLFIYVVGYFSLRQPEVFRLPSPSRVRKDRPRLSVAEVQKFDKRLQYYVIEEKLYLQPDLSLNSLAEKIETSGNNLSWLFNQIYKKSFYDYINEFRVREVLRRIDAGEHEHHTLLAIAHDSGFNTKSTFNKSFKNLMGITPSAYIKSKSVA